MMRNYCYRIFYQGWPQL